jgi:hypothetical protein
MSDELEFELDENDMYSVGRGVNRLDNSAMVADPILDLDDSEDAQSETLNNSSNAD